MHGLDSANPSQEKAQQEKKEAPATEDNGGFGLFSGVGINPYASDNNFVLDSFVSVAKEFISKINPNDPTRFDMIPVDKDIHDVGMDSIWFYTKISGNVFVCYLGLTNTCHQMNPEQITRGNMTRELTQYPQDAAKDDISRANLVAVLHKHFGKDVRFIKAPSIYQKINGTKDSPEFAKDVRDVIKAVYESLTLEMLKPVAANQLHNDALKGLYRSTVLTKKNITNDEKARVEVNIRHEKRSDLQMRDTSGLVYNPDIKFYSSIDKNEQNRKHSSSNKKSITVGVSADVMHVGAPKAQNDGTIIPGQSATSNSQIYKPVFNIDFMDTDVLTPSALLWGLITGTAPLINNRAYLYPFMADKSDMKTEIAKYNHFGAAGAEHAGMHKDPSKTGGHAIPEVLTLPEDQKLVALASIMRTSPSFFMTISPLQRDYGSTSLIRLAAHVSNGSQLSLPEASKESYEFLYNEAMAMTNGKFGNYFAKGKPIAVATGSLRPIGTFETKNGVMNINKITYFVLLSAFSGNKEALDSLRDYTQFLYANDYANDRVRMEFAVDYLKNLNFISNIDILGYGQQYEINPEFITAVINGYADSGVNINTPKIGYDIRAEQERSYHHSAFGGSFSDVNVNRGNGGSLSWAGGTSGSTDFSLF